MRERISFFRSWYQTLKVLPEGQRMPFLEAILSYGFEGADAQFADPMMQALWLNIKPVVDSSNAIIDNTSKGGRIRKATAAKISVDNSVNNSVDSSVNNSVDSSVNNSVNNSVDNSVNSSSLIEKEKEGEMEKEMEKEKELETEKNTPPMSPQGEVPKGTRPQRFVAPSAEQVRDFMAAYCATKGYTIEEDIADRFCDFYASKGWKVGRVPMKSWQCTARNWCRDHGKATANIVNGITLGFDEHLDAQGRYYINRNGIRIDVPSGLRPRREGEILSFDSQDWIHNV